MMTLNKLLQEVVSTLRDVDLEDPLDIASMHISLRLDHDDLPWAAA